MLAYFWLVSCARLFKSRAHETNFWPEKHKFKLTWPQFNTIDNNFKIHTRTFQGLIHLYRMNFSGLRSSSIAAFDSVELFSAAFIIRVRIIKSLHMIWKRTTA